MPKGKDQLPDKKEEQDNLLTKAVCLAPLLSLILQILELLLRILGKIN